MFFFSVEPEEALLFLADDCWLDACTRMGCSGGRLDDDVATDFFKFVKFDVNDLTGRSGPRGVDSTSYIDLG